MSEFLSGHNESVELYFLWKALVHTVESGANVAGLQVNERSLDVKLAFVSEPIGNADDPDRMILWAKWTEGAGIVRASLIYEDIASGSQYMLYDIAPDYILEHPLNGALPTDCDYGTLQEIRLDIEQAVWNPALSQRQAEEYTFAI